MAKVKNHIIEDKSDYLKIAINIGVCIICFFMIGRVGILGKYLSLFLAFLVGDYSTLLLCIILAITIVNILFKKTIDTQHIFFIGAIFIFLGLLMLTHLGLYNSLSMDNKTIITKTIKLFKNYLRSYEMTYSCGGGIIGAGLLQIVCLLTGQIGGAIVGVSFILIGISYFTNVKFFSLFGSEKIKIYVKSCISFFKTYFKNMHFPTKKLKISKSYSINDLSDVEEKSNFILQSEINKEKYEGFKEFIDRNNIQCSLETYFTSYGCSRFVLGNANISESALKRINSWLGSQNMFLRDKSKIYIDYPNQFRKLLTLKSILIETKTHHIPLVKDISGKSIDYKLINGKRLAIIGEENSGIKTTIKTIICSSLIRGIKPECIYLYDLKKDFISQENSNIYYINNIDDTIKSLDELFNEYERRIEVLKYFDLDSIEEFNQHIKKTELKAERLEPIIHIFNVNINGLSELVLNKLVYAIRLSNKVGINIIACVRTLNELMKLELNKMDILCLNISDVSISVKMFGSDIALKLLKKGDSLLRIDGLVYHGQIPYVSESDFERLCFKNSRA